MLALGVGREIYLQLIAGDVQQAIAIGLHGNRIRRRFIKLLPQCLRYKACQDDAAPEEKNLDRGDQSVCGQKLSHESCSQAYERHSCAQASLKLLTSTRSSKCIGLKCRIT
jgi:hypothetical protein